MSSEQLPSDNNNNDNDRRPGRPNIPQIEIEDEEEPNYKLKLTTMRLHRANRRSAIREYGSFDGEQITNDPSAPAPAPASASASALGLASSPSVQEPDEKRRKHNSASVPDNCDRSGK